MATITTDAAIMNTTDQTALRADTPECVIERRKSNGRIKFGIKKRDAVEQ